MKEQLIAKMENLVKMAECDGWVYSISTCDWDNYGKSRTYFVVYETRTNSKHNCKYDCGYLDNISGEYLPGKVDLTQNFTLSGARF